MLNLVTFIVAYTSLSTFSTKGSIMESRIEQIDVKHDHQELIALFYRMELKNFVRILLQKRYEPVAAQQ